MRTRVCQKLPHRPGPPSRGALRTLLPDLRHPACSTQGQRVREGEPLGFGARCGKRRSQALSVADPRPRPSRGELPPARRPWRPSSLEDRPASGWGTARTALTEERGASCPTPTSGLDARTAWGPYRVRPLGKLQPQGRLPGDFQRGQERPLQNSLLVREQSKQSSLDPSGTPLCGSLPDTYLA